MWCDYIFAPPSATFDFATATLLPVRVNAMLNCAACRLRVPDRRKIARLKEALLVSVFFKRIDYSSLFCMGTGTVSYALKPFSLINNVNILLVPLETAT